MLDVREVSFTELKQAKGLEELIAEYVSESANPIVPNAQPMMDRYQFMCEAGAIRLIGAFDDEGKAVGLCGILVAKTQMHSSAPLCSVESFFLRKADRKGLNGLQLLKKAKEIAKQSGAPGLMITTPAKGNFCELCNALGMTHLQNIWWCAL